jgi:hypothetical protein
MNPYRYSSASRPTPLHMWEDWMALNDQQFSALTRIYSQTRRLLHHQKMIRAVVLMQSFVRMWSVRSKLAKHLHQPGSRAKLVRYISAFGELVTKENQFSTALEHLVAVCVIVVAVAVATYCFAI